MNMLNIKKKNFVCGNTVMQEHFSFFLLSKDPISSYGGKYVGGAAQMCSYLCPTH
jgi:hypothetical protein